MCLVHGLPVRFVEHHIGLCDDCLRELYNHVEAMHASGAALWRRVHDLYHRERRDNGCAWCVVSEGLAA